MNIDMGQIHQFLLAPWSNKTQAGDVRVGVLEQDFTTKTTRSRELLKELEELKKQVKPINQRFAHEFEHFAQEIADLLEREEVVDIQVIDKGIRVTTKPVSSFRGVQPFDIDLIIGADKPYFAIKGTGSRFQLRCLDGAGHDGEVRKLLREAKLAEAAALAIDLIEFGDEGGPYNNDDDNNYGY